MFTNLGLVLLLLLASPLVPKFPLVSYSNFKPEAFSYLQITRIGSELIQDGSECVFSCLEITSCFSYNLAAFPDKWGTFLCELLPSDKHEESDEQSYIPSFQ